MRPTVVPGSEPPLVLTTNWLARLVPFISMRETASWSPVTFDTEGQLISIDHYVIHRDTSFAFAASPANSLDIVAGPPYIDLNGQTGNPSVDHYYLVRAVDGPGNKSQDSNRVGQFDRYLTRVK